MFRLKNNKKNENAKSKCLDLDGLMGLYLFLTGML